MRTKSLIDARTISTFLVLALSAAAIARGPNVLLIITDDQGYGDFSIHGNPYLSTPNIDVLARSSIRFDRFFVNSFCAPTRAAVLTGRWPLRCGVHGVTHNREAMKLEEVTLAEAFRTGGYRSACIGKWHNGEQHPYTPQGQGFDEFVGFHNGHWNNYFNDTLLRGTTPERFSGYISDCLTDEAMYFIERNQQQPFFCYLAYNAPHSPYQVPDKYFDKFNAMGLEDSVAAFYGMCENLDDNIGRLLARLAELQLAENTIVVFLTDNGGTAGVKLFNAGMRGGKTSVHEGGTRVPLFVRWPGASWKPHLVNQLTSHIDLYPTLLDLCSVKSPAGPKVDGLSLRSLLESKFELWPERVLFTHNPIDEVNKFPGAVRTERYRLVREIKGPAGGSNAKSNDSSATGWQLYDMVDDPGQKNDLANSNPSTVDRLSQLYDEWFADISRDGLRRFPIPVGYREENPVELHAPQAYFSGAPRFHSGPGYAHDWLEGWSKPLDKIWFDLEVVQPGEYAIEIDYALPASGPEVLLRITAEDQQLDKQLASTQVKTRSLPHRDEAGHTRYQNRMWASLDLGRLKLTPGRMKLVLETPFGTGDGAMEFKQLRLNLLRETP